jgi:hypothetical protein
MVFCPFELFSLLLFCNSWLMSNECSETVCSRLATRGLRYYISFDNSILFVFKFDTVEEICWTIVFNVSICGIFVLMVCILIFSVLYWDLRFTISWVIVCTYVLTLFDNEFNLLLIWSILVLTLEIVLFILVSDCFSMLICELIESIVLSILLFT